MQHGFIKDCSYMIHLIAFFDQLTDCIDIENVIYLMYLVFH